jgi:hypothetical protein
MLTCSQLDVVHGFEAVLLHSWLWPVHQQPESKRRKTPDLGREAGRSLVDRATLCCMASQQPLLVC